MEYKKAIGVLFISGALLTQPTLASARASAGAAAGAAASITARAASNASRSANSASRAAAVARNSRDSANNAAMIGVMGASAVVMSGSSRYEDKKNPRAEIARRVALVNVATVSDDAVLIKEAEIAREELIGYQKFREEAQGKIQAKDRWQSRYEALFNTKNPQDEIAQRINIIKLVGESTDPVLLKEADFAREELRGYRGYKDGSATSVDNRKTAPKDSILNRINIIILAKDVNDDVVQREASIAASELAGYQDHRAVNKAKPIAESTYIQDEIDWRLSIISIAQEFDDPVIVREADIAKSELTDYRNYKEGGAGASVGADPAQTQAQAQAQAQEVTNGAIPNPSASDGVMTDEANDQEEVGALSFMNIVQYGSAAILFLVLIETIRRKQKKINKERDKYIGRKKKNRW